jgi:hypothetical protein
MTSDLTFPVSPAEFWIPARKRCLRSVCQNSENPGSAWASKSVKSKLKQNWKGSSGEQCSPMRDTGIGGRGQAPLLLQTKGYNDSGLSLLGLDWVVPSCLAGRQVLGNTEGWVEVLCKPAWTVPLDPQPQPTNLPTNQPTNQPTYQPINLPVNLPINLSTNLPTYLLTNQRTNRTTWDSPTPFFRKAFRDMHLRQMEGSALGPWEASLGLKDTVPDCWALKSGAPSSNLVSTTWYGSPL